MFTAVWGTVGRRKAKIASARELRRRMTPEETVFWKELRNRKFRHVKFRRQVPIGPFIVDFLCMPLKLVIEVDGGIHEHQPEYDIAREEYLREWGYRILRFRNEEIQKRLPVVLQCLEQEIFRS